MFTSKGINQRLSLGRMGAIWLGLVDLFVGKPTSLPVTDESSNAVTDESGTAIFTSGA